jgi:ketosteroid isomerase-like protein
MSERADDDVRAIEDLIARQFASMSWQAGGAPDLEKFSSDFLPGASLFASARPAHAQSVGQFAERMKDLVGTTLKSFDEQVIGTRIHVFGNVAVAVAACENTENGAEINRNVEMMLLVKDEGRWKIAAQAWDKATDTRPIPAGLLG